LKKPHRWRGVFDGHKWGTRKSKPQKSPAYSRDAGDAPALAGTSL
jgi:hypothetical protein